MVSERHVLGFCRSVPGTPGNGTVHVIGGRSPFPKYTLGTERSHVSANMALAEVVPSSEPAVARSPCSSAASWRAMAGDREGIHGAFVGECRSERPVTLRQTQPLDYRDWERLDYRAHSQAYPEPNVHITSKKGPRLDGPIAAAIHGLCLGAVSPASISPRQPIARLSRFNASFVTSQRRRYRVTPVFSQSGRAVA